MILHIKNLNKTAQSFWMCSGWLTDDNECSVSHYMGGREDSEVQALHSMTFWRRIAERRYKNRNSISECVLRIGVVRIQF